MEEDKLIGDAKALFDRLIKVMDQYDEGTITEVECFDYMVANSITYMDQRRAMKNTIVI